MINQKLIIKVLPLIVAAVFMGSVAAAEGTTPPLAAQSEHPCAKIVDGAVTIQALQNGQACASDCTVGDVALTADIFGSFSCGLHSFTWTFGDGTSAITYTPQVAHYYAQPGVHVVTLQVLGDDTQQLSGNPYVSASALISIVNGSARSLSGWALLGFAMTLATIGAVAVRVQR